MLQDLTQDTLFLGSSSPTTFPHQTVHIPFVEGHYESTSSAEENLSQSWKLTVTEAQNQHREEDSYRSGLLTVLRRLRTLQQPQAALQKSEPPLGRASAVSCGPSLDCEQPGHGVPGDKGNGVQLTKNVRIECRHDQE